MLKHYILLICKNETLLFQPYFEATNSSSYTQSWGNAVFLNFVYLPQPTTIVMVLIAWLSVCVPVCVLRALHSGETCNDLTVSHYFCGCDISLRNSFSLFCFPSSFLLLLGCPHTHTRRCSHTDRGCRSSISTWHPQAVMFSFGVDGVGYNLPTDRVHSLSPLLSPHSINLGRFFLLFICVKLDLCFKPCWLLVFVSFFTPFDGWHLQKASRLTSADMESKM